MKNLIIKSLFLALLFCANTAMVSEQPQTITKDSIAIDLAVDFKGKLSKDAVIEFRIPKGRLVTEQLTKNWSKSFTVETGFNFYFRVKGNLKGQLKTKASIIDGDDTNISRNNMNYDTFTDFDIVKEETL